jgi:hypothetical protein
MFVVTCKHTSILAFFTVAKGTAEINKGMLCVEEGPKRSRLRDREQHGLNVSSPRACIIAYVALFLVSSFPFVSMAI